MKDNTTAKGHVKVFVREVGSTEWVKKVDKKNLVVNQGLNLIRDNLFGAQAYYLTHGAVSDDTNTPAASDTSLGGNEVRVAFQSVNLDTNYQAAVEYYIDATNWGAITSVSKAGLYYQSSGNSLYCAAGFDEIDVGSTTEVLVQWTVSYEDA